MRLIHPGWDCNSLTTWSYVQPNAAFCMHGVSLPLLERKNESKWGIVLLPKLIHKSPGQDTYGTKHCIP